MPHSPNADIRLRFFIWQFQVGKKIIPSLHVSAAHFLKIVFVCFYSKGKRRLIEEKIRRRFLVLLVAGHCHSVLNISSPIKMSVIGILYGGYSFRYQSDFARKTFSCTSKSDISLVSIFVGNRGTTLFLYRLYEYYTTKGAKINSLLPERCSSIWFCTAFPVSRRKQPCQSIN